MIYLLKNYCYDYKNCICLTGFCPIVNDDFRLGYIGKVFGKIPASVGVVALALASLDNETQLQACVNSPKADRPATATVTIMYITITLHKCKCHFGK